MWTKNFKITMNTKIKRVWNVNDKILSIIFVVKKKKNNIKLNILFVLLLK